jgi:hypothetical protein
MRATKAHSPALHDLHHITQLVAGLFRPTRQGCCIVRDFPSPRILLQRRCGSFVVETRQRFLELLHESLIAGELLAE